MRRPQTQVRRTRVGVVRTALLRLPPVPRSTTRTDLHQLPRCPGAIPQDITRPELSTLQPLAARQSPAPQSRIGSVTMVSDKGGTFYTSKTVNPQSPDREQVPQRDMTMSTTPTSADCNGCHQGRQPASFAVGLRAATKRCAVVHLVKPAFHRGKRLRARPRDRFFEPGDVPVDRRRVRLVPAPCSPLSASVLSGTRLSA